jgi:hypothetical protein
VHGIAIGRSSWASRGEAMTLERECAESERSQQRARPWLRYEGERERVWVLMALCVGGFCI